MRHEASLRPLEHSHECYSGFELAPGEFLPGHSEGKARRAERAGVRKPITQLPAGGVLWDAHGLSDV